MDVLYIGAVSVDRLGYIDIQVDAEGKETIKNDTRESGCGGGVYFGAAAMGRLAQAFGHSVQIRIATKCATPDREPFTTALTRAGCETPVYLEGETSTQCENIYHRYSGGDGAHRPQDHRDQQMLSLAPPFSSADLSQFRNADVLMINSLNTTELPATLLPQLRHMANFLVADAQGFCRVVSPKGTMSIEPWDKARACLSIFDLLKVDDREGHALTGIADLEAACRKLASWMKDESAVIGTHGQGLMVVVAGPAIQVHRASFGEWKLEGRTGRGDTATAAVTFARCVMKLDWDKATRFAAHVTTVKMGAPGALKSVEAGIRCI